jgi:septal ring factor EnvC (AmiA/AmiB activator)
MVNCPNCGTEVAEAVKSWPVSFSKPGANGNAPPQFYIGIFECLSCKARFRSRMDLESNPESVANAVSSPAEKEDIRNIVERIKDVREGLIQTLKTLRERINTLEVERSSLMVEIEDLRKAADSRVNSLENEVRQLREEVRSLRELLDQPEQENAQG